MTEGIDYFKTTDLNLASTLLSLGFPIDGIYLKNSSRGEYEFYLKNTPELEQNISAYWQKTLLASPLDIFSARKELIGYLKIKQHEQNS